MCANLNSASKRPPPELSGLCLSIAENSPLPMLGVDGENHMIRYANPAFCRLVDQTAAQLIGRPFPQILPENDESLALLDLVYRTGKAQSHMQLQSTEVHPVYWSYVMWPILVDLQPLGIMIQVTETTNFHE